MGVKPFLTDEQWQRIEPLLPKLSSRGRPWRDDRLVFEGVLWVLKTGARWRDLPEPYPSPSTCWRRLKLWEERGVWLTLWRTFLAELDAQGRLDWSEVFLDGSFVSAKGGPCVGKTKRGKGTKWMVVVDGQGIPLGSTLASASPAEVNLAQITLDAISFLVMAVDDQKRGPRGSSWIKAIMPTGLAEVSSGAASKLFIHIGGAA